MNDPQDIRELPRKDARGRDDLLSASDKKSPRAISSRSEERATKTAQSHRGSRKRRETSRKRFDRWRATHPAFANILVCLCVAASIVLLFFFSLYSGLGSSADFIYNQF